jgi:hypothetical protein
LAELHDEAAENALLANLLGRVPYAGAVLLGAACATAWAAKADIAPVLTWLTLVGAGLAALARSFLIAIAAPFERTHLRLFARDLQAIMLYVGFAWGAGIFLVLPPDVTLLQALAFGTGIGALLALIVQAADVTLCFVAPSALLAAAAALLRMAHGGVPAAVAIVATGLAVIVIALLAERQLSRPKNLQIVQFLPTS